MAMENKKFKIESIETDHQHNPYEYARDDGRSHNEPMNFVVAMKGTVDGKVAYLTHRFGCTKSTGIVNGYHYHQDESDFVKVIEKKSELVKSANPKMFPKAFALCFDTELQLKVEEGQTICVRCRVENKTSKAGNEYLKLTRARIAEEKDD